MSELSFDAAFRRIKELETTMFAMREQLSVVQGKDERLQNIEARLARLEEQLAKVDTLTAAWSAADSSSLHRLIERVSRMDEYKLGREFAKNVNERLSAIEERSEPTTNLIANVSEVVRRLTALESGNANNESRVDNMGERISGVFDQCVNRDREIESRVAALESFKESCKTADQTNTKTVAKISDDYSSMLLRELNLSKRLEALEALQAKPCEVAQGELESLGKRVTELEAKDKERTEVIDLTQATIKTMLNTSEKIRSRVDSLDASHKENVNALTEATKRLQKVEGRIETSRSIDVLDRRVIDLSSRVEQLAKEGDSKHVAETMRAVLKDVQTLLDKNGTETDQRIEKCVARVELTANNMAGRMDAQSKSIQNLQADRSRIDAALTSLPEKSEGPSEDSIAWQRIGMLDERVNLLSTSLDNVIASLTSIKEGSVLHRISAVEKLASKPNADLLERTNRQNFQLGELEKGLAILQEQGNRLATLVSECRTDVANHRAFVEDKTSMTHDGKAEALTDLYDKLTSEVVELAKRVTPLEEHREKLKAWGTKINQSIEKLQENLHYWKIEADALNEGQAEIGRRMMDAEKRLDDHGGLTRQFDGRLVELEHHKTTLLAKRLDRLEEWTEKACGGTITPFTAPDRDQLDFMLDKTSARLVYEVMMELSELRKDEALSQTARALLAGLASKLDDAIDGSDQRRKGRETVRKDPKPVEQDPFATVGECEEFSNIKMDQTRPEPPKVYWERGKDRPEDVADQKAQFKQAIQTKYYATFKLQPTDVIVEIKVGMIPVGDYGYTNAEAIKLKDGRILVRGAWSHAIFTLSDWPNFAEGEKIMAQEEAALASHVFGQPYPFTDLSADEMRKRYADSPQCVNEWSPSKDVKTATDAVIASVGIPNDAWSPDAPKAVEKRIVEMGATLKTSSNFGIDPNAAKTAIDAWNALPQEERDRLVQKQLSTSPMLQAPPMQAASGSQAPMTVEDPIAAQIEKNNKEAFEARQSAALVPHLLAEIRNLGKLS